MKKKIMVFIIGLMLVSCGKEKAKETKVQNNTSSSVKNVSSDPKKAAITWDAVTKDGFKAKIVKSKEKTETENNTAKEVDKIVAAGYTVDHVLSQYLAKDKIYVGIIYFSDESGAKK